MEHNMKKFLAISLIILMAIAFGCGAKKDTVLEDGSYLITVTLDGGSGKASVASPAELKVEKGSMTLTVVWSSDKYDYMVVGGDRFLPELIDGHSVFQIPLSSVSEPLKVTADTTAMSTPHEIDYVMTFDPASMVPAA